MSKAIKNITLVDGDNRIIVEFVYGEKTASELLLAYMHRKLSLPLDTRIAKGALKREKTQELIPLNQTLIEAGVEDDDVLQINGPIDIERTASGSEIIFKESLDFLSGKDNLSLDTDGVVSSHRRDNFELMKSQERFKKLIDGLPTSSKLPLPGIESRQVEKTKSFIPEWVWPDQRTRLQIDYFMGHDADFARSTLEFVLEDRKRLIRDYLILALEDRNSAVANFEEHMQLKRAERVGGFFFTEWVNFTQEQFLSARAVPEKYQGLPINLIESVIQRPEMVMLIWEYVNEVGNLFSDCHYKALKIGFDTLYRLIKEHLTESERLSDFINIDFLTQILQDISILPVKMSLLEKNKNMVLSVVPQKKEYLPEVVDPFFEYASKELDWQYTLREKARDIWMDIFDYWVKQSMTLRLAINGDELKDFVKKMWESLNSGLIQMTTLENLPENLHQFIQQDTDFLKKEWNAFHYRHILHRSWETALNRDIAKMRRGLLKSGSLTLDELSQFLDEGLDGFLNGEELLNGG